MQCKHKKNHELTDDDIEYIKKLCQNKKIQVLSFFYDSQF